MTIAYLSPFEIEMMILYFEKYCHRLATKCLPPTTTFLQLRRGYDIWRCYYYLKMWFARRHVTSNMLSTNISTAIYLQRETPCISAQFKRLVYIYYADFEANYMPASATAAYQPWNALFNSHRHRDNSCQCWERHASDDSDDSYDIFILMLHYL